MKYVIPSYQRVNQLVSKTLQFLTEQRVDNSDVYIFVRDDDPFLNEYNELGEDGYNIITLTNVRGIGLTHNAITTYFSKDTWITELDDDIEYVIDQNRQKVNNFPEVVQTMVEMMETENISFGGFYQCSNPMFMSGNKEYTRDLRYCLGLMRIRKIDYSIVLETNYAEDFENAILHYIKDGRILKNNWIAGKTKNYSAGGCDGDGRNIESEKIDKMFLANKYPNHCKLFQRNNGKWDLRMTKNPVNN